MAEVNYVCHIEFEVTDLERAQTFYETLFGWEFKQFMDSMVIFGLGENHIGGLTKVDASRPAAYAPVWFRVESIAGILERALGVGGSVAEPKKEVPHVGWSATVADPDGNPVGIVEFRPR